MTDSAPELSRVLIGLMKGVIYQESDPRLWQSLLDLQARIRDYVAALGLELILDEAEGYAFLKQRISEGGNEALPRLVARRPLGFSVSLLLALLREKLLETDSKGGDIRLIVSRDQIIEMILLFQPDSSNQAKLMDKLEGHINRVADMGFLRRLPGQEGQFEVRRILKAYIDAQWLGEFDRRLSQYRAYLDSADGAAEEGE